MYPTFYGNCRNYAEKLATTKTTNSGKHHRAAGADFKPVGKQFGPSALSQPALLANPLKFRLIK